MQGVIGIDIGSAYSKGVLMSGSDIVHSVVLPSGGNYGSTADQVRERLLSGSRLNEDDIKMIVATGLGAKTVSFAHETKTDISCHNLCVSRAFPSVRTVVDVGDLHSKAFRMDEAGNLVRFLMSSKCAGGSGRVLKVLARVLQVPVEDLGELSLASQTRVDFNTGCAVFAESEAVSRIAEGTKKEDLVAGIHRALAAQILSLAERVGLEGDFALTGGWARDKGLVAATGEAVPLKVVIPPRPIMTASIGAAMFAADMVRP